MSEVRPIAGTKVVSACRLGRRDQAYLRRSSDGYVFFHPGLKSIDEVRRTWKAFVREYDDAEGCVQRYDTSNPDTHFLNAWQACIDSKPWLREVDILGGDLC